MLQLLNAYAGDSLLDVGCGTGHFSRRFARLGLSVTGIDPDPKSLAFARKEGGKVVYLQGSALSLPFSDDSFDATVAITSLVFLKNCAGIAGFRIAPQRTPFGRSDTMPASIFPSWYRGVMPFYMQ